ncbi:MAG: non-canonical purine NTP diphosphatase [Bacteroidetes bacterium]|nr:MAG: non-canonical purine NTP diphosphatase [Bacteroidota bacterium]
MFKLVFATNNLNKLNEVSNMLPENVELLTLEQIGCLEDIPETHDTLEENALQKARYVYEKYGLNCFADDTGLEVDALDGRPGVHSAHYAGDQRDSHNNMDKLLKELEHIDNRNARFRTVIALILDGEELLFNGIAEGEIIKEKHGEGGFGYDPIFLPEGYQQTFAQMPLKQKNQISHRYKAIKMFADYLMSLNYF